MLRLMENIKFVPVVMFTDNNYVIPTIVTITSLIENKMSIQNMEFTYWEITYLKKISGYLTVFLE